MDKNNDKIKQALDRIEQGLDTINTDKDWLKFLQFQSLFYNYSAGNTILIYLQNPQARYVKGYKSWNKLDRHVKKGSKGIAILAPCIRKVEVLKEPENKNEYNNLEGEKEERQVISGFKIAYVYDIADTDGSNEHLPVLFTGLLGNDIKEQEIYNSLYNIISEKHTVQYVTGTYSKGSYNLETKVISIREDLDYIQKIKTLLHEYAHLLDFANNPSSEIPRNRRELVAESVAFVVSLRLGLDTSSYSMSYINSWLQDKNEIKLIADCVQKISSTIINTLIESSDSIFFCLKEEI